MQQAKYHPFSGRKEHDFVNEMSVIIAKQHLVIRDALQTVNRLQATLEEFIESAKSTRKEDPQNVQEAKV